MQRSLSYVPALAAIAILFFASSAFAAPSVSIQTLSPGQAVGIGSAVTFTAVPSGFSSTSYSFTVYDTDPESKVSNSNINASGNFTWTPTSDDLGLHTMMVRVTAGAESADVQQRIDVGSSVSTNVNTASSSTALTFSAALPSSTVAPGTAVTFGATPSGFTPTSYFTSDSFSGTSVRFDSTSTSGAFSWTPSVSDIGTHTIKIVGYDGKGVNAANTITITVSGTAVAGATSPTPTPVTTTPTVTTPAHTFTLSLQSGDSGSEVLALQQLLARLGYLSTSPNSYYGPSTTAAVQAFQKAKGISALGIVGPSTRAALNAAGGATTGTVVIPTPAAASGGMSAATKQALLLIAQQLQQLAAQLTALAI